MKQLDISKGGFFWERAMYQSDAFLSLSKNAVKMLIALLDDRKRPKEVIGSKKKRIPKFTNLSSLKASYIRLRERYGMNDSGISHAKTELLEKGFIKITNEGGLGQHDQTTYGLTEDYKNWRPGVVIRKRKNDVHRGYQGQKLGVRDPAYIKKTRAGNLRLTHAMKPETKVEVSLLIPETKIDEKSNAVA
jgi:hypothetical protein